MTRFSIKNTELPNAAAVHKVKRVTWVFLMINRFQTIVWFTENQKDIANAAIFLTFLEK